MSEDAATPAPSWWRSPWTVFVALVAGAAGGALMNLLRPALSPELFAALVAPFDLAADIFLRLLKMLVAPLVLFSIMAGMAGIGNPRNLGRMGLRTFAYYIATSLAAIFTGLLMVNFLRPGIGAQLALPQAQVPNQAIAPADIFRRLVPENIFDALARLDMLQIIFFALLAGFAVTTLPQRYREPMITGVQSLFELMTRLAHIVLGVLPIAVFALLLRIVAKSGLSQIRDLGWYFVTVVAALVIHAGLTLPIVCRYLARVSPWRWAVAMSEPLLTAFSTSSSSATLPVTLETVETRGRVKNEVSSFVLPLGATINMDGTALYECVATVFIAQYYASSAGYELTLTRQVIVVLTALLASIGAAGIPSAGLVMMTVILQSLDLPLEGALLVLAVDRPLDMLRTAVNVWSDTICAAVIGRGEGSLPLADETG